VLDHRGVIRYKGIAENQLAAAVEALLKVREAAGPGRRIPTDEPIGSPVTSGESSSCIQAFRRVVAEPLRKNGTIGLDPALLNDAGHRWGRNQWPWADRAASERTSRSCSPPGPSAA
jgi:hypothetical protein